MATLEVSNRFFTQELNNYSCYLTAIFRELTQNALDANCQTISIKINQEKNSKQAIIQFHDDGHGMSENVVRNVYFKLGETTKNETSTIGGFGKARVLTCFAHRFYKIQTQTTTCKGAGATYEIESNQPRMDGCLLEIHLDAVDKRNNIIDVRSILIAFLQKCQLDCKVFVDGVRHTDWLYRRRHARQIGFGDVYINKSGNSNTLCVRVKGVLMFTRYSRAKGQIVVEINPELSRSILLSNRDSLHSEHEQELGDFISEIAVDVTSALRQKFQPYTTRFGNSCFVRSAKKQTDKCEPEKQNIIPSNKTEQKEFLSEVGDTLEKLIYTESAVTPTNADIPTLSRWDIASQNLIISVDSENLKLRRMAEYYNSSWNTSGGRKKRLWMLWTVACEAALDAYTEIKNEDIRYVMGFVFSDNAEAMHEMKDNINCLLVNPSDSDGNFKFDLKKYETKIKLISFAVHEVCHIKQKAHDEDFSTLCTDLTIGVFKNLTTIIEEMDEIMSSPVPISSTQMLRQCTADLAMRD